MPRSLCSPLLLGALLAGASATALVALAPRAQAAPAAPERYRVVVAAQPWQGPRDAKVTIALWADLECPWSSKTVAVLEDLLRRYPRDVRVVWLDFPLPNHRQALTAAIAAHEVRALRGEAGFWRFVKTIYADQEALGKGGSTAQAAILLAARAAGADVRRVQRALTGQIHAAAIRRGKALGERLGVRGTPALFVNGIYLRGHQTLAALTPVVESEIALATRAIAAGSATLQSYYSKLLLHARAAIPGVLPLPTRQLDPAAVYHVPVTGRSPSLGPRDALVTIVMYVDLQCPYCKWGACVLRQVQRHFARDVRLIFRSNPLPFHRRALVAAEALMEAHAQRGNRGFWALHDRLYPMAQCQDPMPHIRSWLRSLPRSNPSLEDAAIRQAARAIGLSLARFDRALRTRQHRQRILAEQAYGTQLGSRGTPGYFVNGLYLRGIRSFAKFKEIVETERRKALQLMRQRRLSRGQVYRAIVARGAKAPVYLP